MLHTLFAAFVTMLFCSCANDVDPKLRARKKDVEKQIKVAEHYIRKEKDQLEELRIKTVSGKATASDFADIALITRGFVADEIKLHELNGELDSINHEIDRQSMIAPNMLVDTMNVKDFDTSNPNAFRGYGLPSSPLGHNVPGSGAPMVCPPAHTH